MINEIKEGNGIYTLSSNDIEMLKNVDIKLTKIIFPNQEEDSISVDDVSYSSKNETSDNDIKMENIDTRLEKLEEKVEDISNTLNILLDYLEEANSRKSRN